MNIHHLRLLPLSEEAHNVSLVENAGSIIVSLLYQIIVFHDIPNTLKILGALLTLTSMVIVGVQKIVAARQGSCHHQDQLSDSQ